MVRDVAAVGIKKVDCTSACAAAEPSSGAMAIAAKAPAAKEQFAASSPDRATLPSRLAIAMRCGVASKVFSPASLTSSGRDRQHRLRRALCCKREDDNGSDERGRKRQRKEERKAAEARNDSRKRAECDLNYKG